MILEILLLSTAQAAEPSVRRQTVEMVSPSFPYELREQVAEYLRCLEPEGRSFLEFASVEAQHRKDVERCEAELGLIMDDAVVAWTASQGPNQAEDAVGRTFANMRDGHIARGRQLDEMLGRSSDNAVDSDQ